MRDLVDHIRTIHFTLVIASCVVSATALARSNRSLEQAIADAKAIVDLNTPAQRTQVAKAMEDQANRAFGVAQQLGPMFPPKPGEPAFAPFAQLTRAEMNWRDKMQYEPWIATNENPSVVFASPYPGWVYLEQRTSAVPSEPRPPLPQVDNVLAANGPWTPIELPSWETLSEFREYWDGRPTLVEALTGLPAASFHRVVLCADKRKRAEIVSPRPATESIGYRTTWDEKTQSMSVEMTFADCTVSKPSALFIDAREALVQELRRVNNSAYALARGRVIAPFSEGFSDLDRQTTYLKNMALPDLVRELVRRSDENEGSIQIFGASFPATVIASLGTLMIVSALLYLLMHINELEQMAADTSEHIPSGYIGLYRRWLPRAVTAVTLILLPSVAIWLIVGQAQEPVPPSVMYGVSSIAAGFGILCVVRLHRVLNLAARVDREPRGAVLSQNSNE